MFKSIKAKLFVPVFILIIVGVVGLAMAIYANHVVVSSEQDVQTLDEYAGNVSQLRVELLEFFDDDLSYSELVEHIEPVKVIPSMLTQQMDVEGLHQVPKLLSDIDELNQQLSVIYQDILSNTDASITESNSYMQYMQQALTNDRNSVSTDEINTIEGANNNTNSNYIVQRLFLIVVNDIHRASELLEYVQLAVENTERGSAALAGTPMEAASLRALAMNRQVQQLSQQYVSLQTQRQNLIATINTILAAASHQLVEIKSKGIVETFTHANRLIYSLVAIFLVGMLLVATVNILVGGAVRKNLHLIYLRAAELADAEGDLRKRIEAEGSLEVNKVVAKFNQFIEQIQRIVVQVKQMSGNSASLSQSVSYGNQQILQDMDTQLQQTNNLASATEEMSMAIAEVAQNAMSAADQASAAQQEAQQGREELTQVDATANSMASEVGQACTEMTKLEGYASDIGSVVEVINSIAEQTNLLALNAAIEAARAGEHGRGFSVVADEVRTLATKTQTSLNQIQQTVERLQQTSKVASELMQRTQTVSQEVTDSVKLSASRLRDIHDKVAQITDINHQIAASVEEQSTVTKDINRGVVTIRDLSDGTQGRAREVVDATTKLDQLSTELSDLVGHFQTD